MNFNDIIEKFGYDANFAAFLKEIYYELIKKFKNEEIIYNALMATPIVSASNIFNYLKENDMLIEDDVLVTANDLKRSSGVYHSDPKITFNANSKTYQIQEVKRVIVIVDFDLNSVSKKATLIHELGHLVKSFYNEYVIEDDILIEHSGLIKKIYKLFNTSNNVSKSLVKEIGVGLEEGETSLLEEDITKKIVTADYESKGYGVVYGIASNLSKINGLQEIIYAASLYHDKSELEEFLGLENFQQLENLGDRMYKLNLEYISQAFDAEKRLETVEEIKNLITSEYQPLWEKITTDLKRG